MAVSFDTGIFSVIGINSELLIGAKLYWYASGTSTPLATYSDNGLTTPNTNPVVANGAGRFGPIWLQDAEYKMILTLATADPSSPLVTRDPVSGLNPLGQLLLPSGAGLIGASQDETYDQGTLGNHYNNEIFVTDAPFNAVADNATDNTAAFASAIAATPAGGGLIFPPGKYKGVISVRRNDITLYMAGATITTPAGVDSITLELGDTASGNAATAYSNVNVLGYPILDGNYTNTPAPSTDLTGQGFIATKISNSVFQIKVQNTHNACAAIVIDSNYNSVDIEATNGGQSLISGGRYPNIDFNSSKYCTGTLRSSGGYYGLRVLDACKGLVLDAAIFTPATTGVVVNDQLVNETHGCIIRATVEGGCTDYAMLIGANVRACDFTVTANAISGVAAYAVVQTSADNNPTGNVIRVRSRLGQVESCVVDSTDNEWDITSTLDGRATPPGIVTAVRVVGDRNTIRLAITDSSTPNVRGIKFESTASKNVLTSYTGGENTVEALNDGGTNNRYLLSGSDTYTNHTIADGGNLGVSVPVTGAKPGMACSLGYSTDLQGMQSTAEVQTAGLVVGQIYNGTGGSVTLTGGTANAVVQAA